MEKIQYTVYKQETGSAGGKAKNDAFDILLECGFVPSYKQADNRIIRIIKQFYSIARLNRSQILIVQYPTVSQELMPYLMKKMSKMKYTIGLVHDVPAFQGMGGEIENQIEELNQFTFLIVHNEYMKRKLQECGCKANMIPLYAFDYLHDYNKPVVEERYNRTICVAGNLDKSMYLSWVGKISRYQFNLYGINKVMDFATIKNVNYKGLFPSEQIVYSLEGNYGLVWDGESIETCTGVHGDYLRINNPHKMSLYLAAGKPIITWKQAAIADFVKEKEVGVLVDSLEELNDIDLSKDYIKMKSNAEQLRKRLAEGNFLKSAVNEILNMIPDKN